MFDQQGHQEDSNVIVGPFYPNQNQNKVKKIKLLSLFNNMGLPLKLVSLVILIFILSGAFFAIKYSFTKFSTASLPSQTKTILTTKSGSPKNKTVVTTNNSTTSKTTTSNSSTIPSKTPVATVKISSGNTTVNKPSPSGNSTSSGGSSSSTGTSSGSTGSSGSSGSSGGSSSGSVPYYGVVTAGNSKANCIQLNIPNGFINDSQFSAVTAITGVAYNCVITYNDNMPAWSNWDNPWQFTSYYNWGAWVAESTNHQVVLAEDLIPTSLENNSNPLTWEQSCAAGNYNSYATTLGDNLVAEGGANTIIRLGVEANGTWEDDFVGTTTQEQNAWAQCFDQEVSAMRAVPNNHFLFVWNPNICTQNLPLNEWYPGNAYVDIIGADAYNLDCGTSKTVSQEGWTAYSTDSSSNSPNNPNFPSLANIESFAVANGKPFALPEWGLDNGYPDDATYVTNIANIVRNTNTSFQAYFDCGCDSITPLGNTIPLATAAYSSGF